MKIKKVLAGILASLMILTSPISALALDNVNGTGSGETHEPSTPEIVGSLWKVHANQGWRITCVNADGIAVSTSLDIVHYFPEKVGDVFKQQSQGLVHENVSMLWNNYVNNSGIHRGEKKSKILYLGGAKTDTWYTWSRCNLDGSGSNNGVYSSYRVNGDYTPSGNIEGNVQFAPSRMITYSLLMDCIKTQAEAQGATLKVDGSKVTATYPAHDGTTRTINAFIDDPLHEGQTADGAAQLTGTGKMFRDQLMSPVELTDGTTDTLLTFILNCKIYDCDGRGNRKSGNFVPMLEYLDPVLKTQYESLKAEGDEKAFTKVFDNNNIRLVIEPIHWSYTYLVNPKDPDPNKRGAFFKSSYGSPEIIYGPVSKVYDYTVGEYQASEGKRLGISNYSWTELVNYISHNACGIDWAWGLHDEAAMLDHDEPSLGLTAYDQSTQDVLGSFLLYHNTLGFGCMVTGLTEKPSGTPTWDSSTYPSDNYKPGPAPDTSDRTKYPKETSYNNNNNKSNIVKFYVRKQGDSEVPVSNFTRENTLHTININDEPGYKVVDYFSSTTYKKPESSSTTYESVKSTVPNGSLKGTSSGSVVLTPESNENTLYIKLISNVKVVKVYETGGNVDKVVTDTNPNITNNTLNITTPDGGYEYTENIQSPTDKTPSSWEDVPEGTPGTEVNVPIRDDTTTIYIHYHKDGSSNTGLVLHENEISHQFGLSDVKGTLLDGIRKYSSVSVSGSCDYWYDGDDDDDGYYCGAPYEYQNSDDWTYTIENVPSYNTQFVWKWVQTDQKSYSGNGLSESGGEGHSTPDMKMVLQRSISDKGTLYPKLNADESILKAMGLQGAAYQPVHQRKDGVSDQPSRKSWTETFTTNWTFTAHNTPTAYFATDHGYSDTDEHTNTGNESELNSNYSQSGNTLVYGLWGKANEGIASVKTLSASEDKWQYSGLKFNGLRNFTAETVMNFYPFYRMKYVSELDGSEKDAYLTSENLSKLINTSRIDMSMFKSKSGLGLKLSSTQWSIHAGAQKLIKNNGFADKDSLLPAGAIFTLSSASTDNTIPDCWVGARIFQTYIPDKSVLVDSTGVLNKAEAESKITAFKQQMDKSLDNYEIVMMGLEGIESNPSKFDESSEQITGKEGKYKLGRNFDKSSKYDLQTGSTGADRSDLDIIGRADEGLIDWGFKADVDGNITITKNGATVETLNKTQKVATNAEVKDVNAQTKILDNFVSALDRNLGSDRSGRSWYNEGFEVHMIENKYAVQLGFDKDHEPQRSNALNIQANGKLQNRQDMYNGDSSTLKEKARTYRFQISPRTTAAEGASHNVAWIGNFGDVEIFMPGIQHLMQSKLFVTSNTTVMDLN